MDVYQNIWTSCDKGQLERHNQLVSESARHLGLFQREDDKLLKAHVAEVNSLLNSGKTRERGFRLLADLLPHCAQQVLSVQCERWFKFCCDAITSVRQGGRVVVAASQLLSSLLRDASRLPELQRCVSAKSSAAVVPVLAAMDPMANPAALECLYEYLRRAPGPCLQHKNTVEEKMLSYLDNPVTTTAIPTPAMGPGRGGGGAVRLAGRVFAALPLSGIGGGNAAQSRADARGRQLGLLLSLAHSLLDTLLEGVLEKESYPLSRDHSALKLRPVEEVTPDPMTARVVTIARLTNTLAFIAEMVTDCDANSTITTTPGHLLSVVVRLLQVETAVLRRYKSQEHKLVAFFLPSLHNHALLLLKDMIDSLSSSLDHYYSIIADILVSIARSSYKSPSPPSSKSTSLRERDKDRDSLSNTQTLPPWHSGGLQTKVLAYGVLAEVVRASRGRHTPPAGLVAMLIQDATPQQHNRVRLQEKGLAGLSLQKISGKKKGYTVTSQSSPVTTAALAGPLPRPAVFGRLARVSLVLSEMLFTHASHSMPFEDHQRLQNGVLTIAEGVLGSPCTPEIYADARVRVQLFFTLAALSTAPHPCCPPPYTLLTQLLHTGTKDLDAQVASVCQMALCSVSLVVANPKVELASQAYQQQLQQQQQQQEEDEEEEEKREDGRSTHFGDISGDRLGEEKDAEVDMIVEQLEEEEEEEEEEDKEEEEVEEILLEENYNEEKEEEKAWEGSEEEEEEVTKGETELSDGGERKEGYEEEEEDNNNDKEEVEDQQEEEEEEEEDKKERKGGTKRGRKRRGDNEINEEKEEEEEMEAEEDTTQAQKGGVNKGKGKGKGRTTDKGSKTRQQQRNNNKEQQEEEEEPTTMAQAQTRSSRSKTKKQQQRTKEKQKETTEQKNKEEKGEDEREQEKGRKGSISISPGKRSGGKTATPAKRIKSNTTTTTTTNEKVGGGEAEVKEGSQELSVEEMLKDFVDS